MSEDTNERKAKVPETVAGEGSGPNESLLGRKTRQVSEGLVIGAGVHEFFEAVVTQALAHRADRPGPVVEHYLVGLLEDAAAGEAHLGAAVDAPLALALAAALAAPPAVRFERLWRLGDAILLVGGLYQPHLSRVGLEDGYVTAVGGRAYQAASALVTREAHGALVIEGAEHDILGILARRFRELMLLLRDVADTLSVQAARSSGDLVRLLERWVNGGSEHLGRLLRGQGLVLDIGVS